MDIKQDLLELAKWLGKWHPASPEGVRLEVVLDARAEIERLERCIGTWLTAEEEWKRELAECKRERNETNELYIATKIKLDAYTDRMITAGLMS